MPTIEIEPGVSKFPRAQLLSTSGGRQWGNLSAERRGHRAGEIPDILPNFTEITYAIKGNPDAFVNRRMVDVPQSTRAINGTLWLCPEGVPEDRISITEDLPDILHVYLNRELFTTLSGEDGCPDVRPEQVAITAGVKDELIESLMITIGQELTHPTEHGKLLVDSVALTLCARLIQTHSTSAPKQSFFAEPRRGLDVRRLQRVIDFMESSLDENIELADLAAVACLSPFHFSRSFKIATGEAPLAFLIRLRLERAKSYLRFTRMPIEQVGIRCGFPSQAGFTRAFTRVVGIPPGEYRRQALR